MFEAKLCDIAGRDKLSSSRIALRAGARRGVPRQGLGVPLGRFSGSPWAHQPHRPRRFERGELTSGACVYLPQYTGASTLWISRGPPGGLVGPLQGVSRPALACVGMALHEAPFNGDAEQRPLGEAKLVDTPAYHLAAAYYLAAASPPKGRASLPRVTAHCRLVASPSHTPPDRCLWPRSAVW